MNKAQLLLAEPRTTSSGFRPPRADSRGIYHNIDGQSIGFTVVRSNGNLCYVRYDNTANEVTPFIYKFKVGRDWEMNRLHEWPGKVVTMADLMEFSQS